MAIQSVKFIFIQKGKNKVSLRYQSVLMRVQGSKNTNYLELPE
jgi:hypothetical protein